MSVLDEQTDRVVLEGLDFEVPCDTGRDHKAEVVLRCRRCGTSSMHCRLHLAAIRRDCESLNRSTRVIGCRVCRAAAQDLDVVFEVVPL